MAGSDEGHEDHGRAAAPTARRTPHGTQALDFEKLVKRAGLTPARAIQGGTIINAEAHGLEDQIGSIDKGKYADLSPSPATRWPTSPSSSA